MHKPDAFDIFQFFQLFSFLFTAWNPQKKFELAAILPAMSATASSTTDDQVLVALKRFRSRWTLVRSEHWISHVLTEDIFLGNEFEKTFRMTRNSFNHLHALLEPYIGLQDTRFRLATSSKVRLLVFLYHVMQGANYRTISNLFAIGVSDVSKCVHDVARQILIHLWHLYIHLPSIAETRQNIDNWRFQTGIPGIAGVVDGSHIAIRRPCRYGEVYFNRKGFYSLNVQAVVDYKKRFIDVEAGWPGSVGDGRVWRNSALHRRHKEWLSQFACTPLQIGIREEDGDVISEDIPTFILADSAYPNTKHMVTTFKTTECADPVINALNQKLGGARYHVQNAFGILKARFQIFQRPLECAIEDIRFAIVLTSAIFVLHNFLIDLKDETREDVLSVNRNGCWDDLESNGDEDENEQDEEAEVEDDLATRPALIRHMKYLLLEE